MDPLPLIIFSLIFSAFFSGTEIAFVTANKFRIELSNKQGNFVGSIMSGFIKAPSQFIGTMLVGNNIALVVYGIFMAEALEPFIRQSLPPYYENEATILIIQTIISTFIILITGEFLPKVLFRINPNRMLEVFAVPILFFYYLLYPVVFLIRLLSEQVLRRMFRIETFEANVIFGRIDLDHFIQEIKRTETDNENGITSEIEMFQNALAFNEIKVRECMIPRTEIIAISIDSDIEELRQIFADTGLSRILIYRDNIDNIIGFVHSYEMFKQPKSIQSVILPITIVPESMPARELLTLFTQQHRSIALVVDEFGGTAGIVTMEDVIEEIFGEIDDEHDVEDLVEKQINEKEFIFSGRLEIDYLNREYNLNLPEDESYETLAGLIIHHHESIPEVNEEINLPPYKFTILQVSDTRIDQVKLMISDDSD